MRIVAAIKLPLLALLGMGVFDTVAAGQLVIRSISQTTEVLMVGDRSSQDVQAAYQAQSQRPTAVSLCAWPLSCAAPPPRAARLDVSSYADEIVTASTAWQIDPQWVRAVIHAESSFNPLAISPKGAQGLMQLMPATAARFEVADAFDPIQNIQGGVQYLSWLLARYNGDRALATAAYNAGEGAVDRYGGIPPYRETVNYVAKVERLTRAYQANAGGQTTDTEQSVVSNAPHPGRERERT